jgi:hypothetical protein
MHDDEFVWSQHEVEGKYATCFRIGFNAFELLIDFAQCTPMSRLAVLHTRIIVSPTRASVLLEMLRNTLNQHHIIHERRQND